MLTLHLTLTDRRVSVRANGKESHQFSLLDLSQTKEEWKDFLDNPRVYGEKLFNALFRDASQARVEFDALSKQSERTIVLVLESSDLDVIAWEYAYNKAKEEYVVEEFAFVRALPENERPANGRLKAGVERVPLLFIPSNPLIDQSGEPMRALDVEKEWKKIETFIKDSGAPFDMCQLQPPTIEELQTQMAKPQLIIHFSGHGGIKDGEAQLLFELKNGASDWRSAREFISEIKDKAAITFLSACQSAVAERTEFSNLARGLVKAGVPFALGMQFNLPDPFAPDISGQFYNYLTRGHGVPEAARQARRAVKRQHEFFVGMIALYAAHPDEVGQLNWNAKNPQTLSLFRPADVSDLPSPASGLIGRQRELMRIGTQLLEGKKPLTVTLHGAGGIGKTALLWQALLRFAPSFELTLAIALDPLPSLESVLGRIERFLGLPSPCSNDTQEREAIVRDALTSKRTLLGLDNFETLNYALNEEGSDEEKTAKSLHSFFKSLAANGVTLCVTSREITNLPGETIEDIEGLSNESGGRLFQENVVKQKDKIYIERTQQVSEMVGGHPLALRLLASAFDDQVGTSLDQYIGSLQSFLPKARDKWTEEDRHESLRASFDFTMKNLVKTTEGRELQSALSRLSVFIAFFASFVASPVLENHIPEKGEGIIEMLPKAEAALNALWERGLLERINLPLENEVSLYRLHPALNQFAAEHTLPEEQNKTSEIHWRLMCRLANGAYPFKSEDSGIYGNTFLARVVFFAMPDLLKATKFRRDEETSTLLYCTAFLQKHFGNFDEAIKLYQQSHEIFEEIGDPRGEGKALAMMARVYVLRGDFVKAMQLFQAAIRIFDRLGDLKEKSTTLHAVAGIYSAQGDFDGALNLYEESLGAFEKLGDVRGKSSTVHEMANIYVTRGDLDRAMKLYSQGYEIDNALGDFQGKSAALHAMANISVVRGDWDGAMKLYQQSLDSKEDIGDLEGMSGTLSMMAQVCCKRGELDEAMKLYKESLKIKESLGELQGMSVVLNNMAVVYVEKGDTENAMRLYQQSLEIAESLGDLRSKGTTINNMAQILVARQDLNEAMKLFQMSLEITEKLGDLNGKASTLTNIGAVLFQNNELQHALRYLVDALIIFENIEAKPNVETVANLLVQFRQVVGADAFETLWAREIKKPIPNWLNATSEENNGDTDDDDDIVEQFIAGAIQSAREKRPEAEGYFKSAQKMAADSSVPAELRELGRVIQRVMLGDKNVDLSSLPREWAEAVRREMA